MTSASTTVVWSPQDFVTHLDQALAVYGAAMGYPPATTQLRRGQFGGHIHLAGFRAVANFADSQLLGFGYGYRSLAGQWWHDTVFPRLPTSVAAAWFGDCFELAELHVAPHAQGRRLGTELLTALLAQSQQQNVMLSTPEVPAENTAAWRLYRRFGFVDILRNFYFPSDPRQFAVLGLHRANLRSAPTLLPRSW